MITVNGMERVAHPIDAVFDAGTQDHTWPKSKKEDPLQLEITPQDKKIRNGSVVHFDVRVPAVNLGTIAAKVTRCESPSLLVIEGRSSLAELVTRFDLSRAGNGEETDVAYHLEAEIRRKFMRCLAEPAIKAALNIQLPRVVAEYIDNVSAHINKANGIAL